MQEYDGFVEAGLALPAPHAVDAVQGKPATAKHLGEQLIARKRMPVELAVADHVRQATAPGTNLGDLARMLKKTVKIFVNMALELRLRPGGRTSKNRL